MKSVRRIVFFSLLAIAMIPVSCTRQEKVKPTKNVILMVPDGVSTSVLSLVRWYNQQKSPQNVTATLATDPYLCGMVRQSCSDSPVPASPAAMTSFMTGYKVQGSNMSVYPSKNEGQDLVNVNADSTWQPLATVMEAAKILGHKSTGLVVTVTATHATPGATTAHTVSRSEHHDIIRQMASNRVDVIFGGGVDYMDDDVKSILEDNGITYIEKDVPAFRAAGKAPVWALFAGEDMAFDLDRDTLAEPSLCEMTEKALSLLSKDKNGFFLMVEGSKVDYAAHSNDPMGIISEYDAFDKAVAVAMDFAKKDGNTTVIVVPDHGNSGMTMGNNDYKNYYKKGLDTAMAMLPQYKRTGEGLTGLILAQGVDRIRPIFKEYTGIDLTPAEEKAVRESMANIEKDYMEVALSRNLKSVVTKILNAHVHFGYASGCHTSEDVFLAVYNPNGQVPMGWIDGTDLAGYMYGLLGVKGSLDELTSQIFVKYDVLLAGHETAVEGDKKAPVLVIDGKVRVPANSSYIEVDGQKKELASVSVYVPKNKNFYISREILNYL
ncbi:alkaline phosphatase family protein [Bacteroides sp. CAG:709]|nr:alkaline phosphatase family protein [Bacteroides sp. CAG:709]